MTKSNSPSLLPTSENSPLLDQHSSNGKKKPSFKRYVFILILFSLIFGTTHTLFSPKQKPKKTNIIFFVTDGMGPASLSLTRSFRQFKYDLPINDTLVLDKHLIGSSRTMSSNSLVTDSAAGATAFSCAAKSYNGAIGVFPDKKPCGTVLEALKLQGFMTGLVVTTSITDATPAAFSAHTDYRSQQDLIAEHQLGQYSLGRMVDVMIGGGRCHYYGCRDDNRNLLQEAVDDGWTYVGNRTEFDKLNMGKINEGEEIPLPLLALMADRDIPFELDRDDSVHPSLAESSITALNLLHSNPANEKGLFILIEGSRIDHGGHFNDPAAQVNEVLAFDEAFQAVKDWADSVSDEADTIMISTSDHETGGLSVARQIHHSYPDYLWLPEVLNNVTHTAEYVNRKIKSDLRESILQGDDLKKYLVDEISENFGISDLSTREIDGLLKVTSPKTKEDFKASGDAPLPMTSLMDHLVNLINVRAQIGWSTHGHSAVDVNIYGHGSSPEVHNKILGSLSGNHENTEIGGFMADIIDGVDLDEVTELIKDTKHAPDLKQMEIFLGEEIVETNDETLLKKIEQKVWENYVR
ncbi:alkaline phosphatase [Saccharomycopsis crataegensis]|uniref:Alkaline phosphatase n=1 Tax=Saccharomycopsis crataegensis TaxID=43959 RepID=A0AAV5QUC4_9ASCO|nr:alkaline phosphatase [Saccharomycopsis crataegensis]